MRKSQSALEFLSVYAWAFIIIGVTVVVTSILFFSNSPATYLPSTCYISPNLPCSESVLFGNSTGATYTVIFSNRIGTPIYLQSGTLNVSISTSGGTASETYMIGNCTPQLLPNGGQAICIATANSIVLQEGGSTAAHFSLRYEICKSGAQDSCGGSVYRTTGISQQVTSSGKNAQLHKITLYTSTGTGYVVLDGIAHPSNTILIMASAQHIVDVQPPLGYAFQHWTNSSIAVANPYQHSTTITVTGNGILTAILQTTTSTSSTSTSTTTTTSTSITTSTSSTSTSTTTTTSTSITTSTSSTSTSTTTTTSTVSTALGYMYCMGGNLSSATSYYAPVSGSGINPWTATTSYPFAIQINGFAYYNGYIYSVGGYNGGAYSSAYYAQLSSSGIGSWSTGTSYPAGTWYFGCAAYNGYIYCIGGSNTSAQFSRTDYYAPISSSAMGPWSATTLYPVGTKETTCIAYNGYLYCVGGYNASVVPSRQTFYAPVSSSGINAWTQTTPYPTPIVAPACVQYGGYIYCVGGGNATSVQSGGVYFAQLSSSGIGVWTKLSSYGQQVAGVACGAGSGYIYCVGGYNGTVNSREVWYSTISTSSPYIGGWSKTSSYPLNGAFDACTLGP